MSHLPEFRPERHIDNVAARGAIHDDIRYRQEQASWGSIDLWLSAKAAMVTTVALEAFQTDYQDRARLLADLPSQQHPDNWMERLASAPFDWKAVGVAAGAYAITSAAGRIRHSNAVEKDIAKVGQAIHEGAHFAPYTKSQQRRERFMRRTKRGVATLVAGVAGYKAGEQLPQMTDVKVSLGMVGVALASVPLAKAYTKHQVRRIQEAVSMGKRGSQGSKPASRIPEDRHLTDDSEDTLLPPSSARYDWWNA